MSENSESLRRRIFKLSSSPNTSDSMTSADRSDTKPTGRRVPFVSTPDPAPDLSVRATSGAPTVVFVRP